MKFSQSFFIVTIFLYGCANPVSPTGGEKDVQPPKIISIDSTTKSGIVSVYFDENIKFQNNIQLNPTKGYKKAKVEVLNKSVNIQIYSYTSSISFNDAVSDLNENNIGKYPFILLNQDSIRYHVRYQNNQSGKVKVNGLIRIDSLQYMADNSQKELLRFEGLPKGKKEIIIYSDDNKNNQYDESEFYSEYTLEKEDSSFTYLYPQKKETVFIQQKDTSLYSYLVTTSVRLRDSIAKRSQIESHLDTLKYFTKDSSIIKEVCAGQLIKKLNIKNTSNTLSTSYIYVDGKDSMFFTEYPLFYQGSRIHKPIDGFNQIQQDRFSYKKDSTVKAYRKIGKVEFQNDSNVNFSLVVYKGKSEISNSILKRGNTTIILPTGSYTYLIWKDENQDQICNPGEDILNYYFGMDVNAQLTNTIIVKKSQKQEKNSPNTKTILSE